MFERFLFSKIEVWVLIVFLIVGAPAVLLFGWVVQYKAAGGQRGGAIGDVMLSIAQVPETLIRTLFGWPQAKTCCNRRYQLSTTLRGLNVST